MVLRASMAATSSRDDDAALVGRARLGDATAFDQLYLRYRDRVYALCSSLCADHDEARDLLQETFVNAWRGLPRFAGRCAFTTWLHRIAVNVCRGAARRRRWPIEAHLNGPSPDHLMTQYVRAVLATLQPNHRIILALRYSQSLSYQEIADCLGWSLPRVRVTLHRARRAFREAYSSADEEKK